MMPHIPDMDVGKCGARPRQIVAKKCESMDASTFFGTLYYADEETARARERDTTINVTIAVKSCRTFGRAFPFVSDAGSLTAPDVARYSRGGEGENRMLF